MTAMRLVIYRSVKRSVHSAFAQTALEIAQGLKGNADCFRESWWCCDARKHPAQAPPRCDQLARAASHRMVPDRPFAYSTPSDRAELNLCRATLLGRCSIFAVRSSKDAFLPLVSSHDAGGRSEQCHRYTP